MERIEETFLDYNIDNIFINLIQAETHLKNLDESEYKEGYLSCLNKHLAEVEGEASEAITHSFLVNPEKSEAFKEIRNQAHKIRKSLKHSVPSILEVRNLRKIVEQINPGYDTSNCKACSFSINEKNEKKKEKLYILQSLNTNILKNSNDEVQEDMKITGKQAGYLALGNIGGKFVQEGVAVAATQMPDELMPGTGITLDMVLNIAAGAGLTYYGVKYAKDANVSLAATAAGVSILADKGIDYIKGAMGLRSAPLRLAAPLQVRATPTFQSITTAPITAVVGGERPLLL